MPNSKIVTDLTDELWKTFDVSDPKDKRRAKEITFLIEKIAILQEEIRTLKSKMNGLERNTDLS